MLEEADEFAKLLCQLDAATTVKPVGRHEARLEALRNIRTLVAAMEEVEEEERLDPASPTGETSMYDRRVSFSLSLQHWAAVYYLQARDEGPWS